MRALLAVLALLSAAAPAGAFTYVSIGTGDVDGGYYAAAAALCARVNEVKRDETLRCAPESTSGSLYNLSALAIDQLDLAIVQSDWQKRAVEGASVFADDGPMTDLRSVMSLYPEAVTLLVRRDAEIGGLRELIGKRVDIGHPSSGRHGTMLAVMEAAGLTEDMFAEVVELQSGSAIAQLCAGRIDATALIIGHPNAQIARALDECDIELAPLTGPAIDALLAENPDYRRFYIPMQAYYPTLDRDVATFAVTATLVARESTDPAVVQALVEGALDNLDALRAGVPILENLEPGSMRDNGLTAPLHPAAAAAFDAYDAEALTGG